LLWLLTSALGDGERFSLGDAHGHRDAVEDLDREPGRLEVGHAFEFDRWYATSAMAGQLQPSLHQPDPADVGRLDPGYGDHRACRAAFRQAVPYPGERVHHRGRAGDTVDVRTQPRLAEESRCSRRRKDQALR